MNKTKEVGQKEEVAMGMPFQFSLRQLMLAISLLSVAAFLTVAPRWVEYKLGPWALEVRFAFYGAGAGAIFGKARAGAAVGFFAGIAFLVYVFLTASEM